MAEINRYLIPAAEHSVSEEISRSRFITTLAHASSREDAEAFIAAVRAEHRDATHNCWAFIAGPPGSSMHVGMSDDGEPHGTAGLPMLNILMHSGIGEIVAVVTRYYGGTKLGTGGLARAYSGGVKLALVSLPTTERIDWREVTLALAYPLVEQLRLLFPRHEVQVDSELFTEQVSYRLRLPAERLAEFRRAVTELSSGRARFD